MKNIYLLAVLTLILSACSVNLKKNNLPHGFWIEKYKLDTIEYKDVGRYNKGEQIKTWKYYSNKEIYKKEKFKKDGSTITYYFENGKIQSKGKTKLKVNSSETHWFYYGEWKYYNDKGKLIMTRIYDSGNLITEIQF